MTTLYVRRLNLKASLSDAEVLETWQYLMEEVLPAIEATDGTLSCKIYSGAGALRADLVFLWEMEDASVYERALLDPSLRNHLGRVYSTWDMTTATQTFRREVTPALIQALSGGS